MRLVDVQHHLMKAYPRFKINNDSRCSGGVGKGTQKWEKGVGTFGRGGWWEKGAGYSALRERGNACGRKVLGTQYWERG